MCKIRKERSWFRKLLIGILIVVAVGGLLGGVIALSRNTDKIENALTYKSVGWTNYGVGGLDSNGNYMSTDKSIYTKKAFECQGLNVTPDFDSEVSYQIYFYDQNNQFVHTTGRLTGTFVQDSVPFFAKYARIVITPNDDSKVTVFELAKYAKQIETKIYREQGYKNYTEDLFRVRVSGATLSNAGEVSENEDVRNVVSDYINVKAYNEALFFRTNGDEFSSGFKFHLYDITKTHIGWVDITSAETVFVSSNGDHYYKISLSSLNSNTVYISYSTYETNPVHFYCR